MGKYKTPQQIEFADLVKASGLKKAGIARLVKMSRASITKILKGDQNPTEATLDHLRTKLSRRFEQVPPPVVKTPQSDSDNTTQGSTVYKIDEEGTAPFSGKDDGDSDGGIKEVSAQLAAIREQDESGYQVIKSVVGTFYKAAAKKNKKSGTVTQSAKKHP